MKKSQDSNNITAEEVIISDPSCFGAFPAKCKGCKFFDYTNFFCNYENMKENKLLKALFKLCNFCSENKIAFSVTGDMALYLLGIPTIDPESINMKPTKPKSISIRVYNLVEELELIEELKSLADITSIKIKALIDNISDFEDINEQNVYLSLADSCQAKLYIIPVQRVYFALKEKMCANRHEGTNYMLNLINTLTSL